MEDYPSNSQRRPPEKPAADEKQIEKIATGPVITRKPPYRKRLMAMFIQRDLGSVWLEVVDRVLIQAAKDMVVDAGEELLRGMFFGEGGRAGRGRRSSGAGFSTGTFVNYQRPTSSTYGSRREEPRLSRRARANHNFNEIILGSRVEAEEIIDRLFDIVARYEVASVSDLYKMLGETPDFTDDKWGWTDLRGASATRIANGQYLLDLPRPEPLD